MATGAEHQVKKQEMSMAENETDSRSYALYNRFIFNADSVSHNRINDAIEAFLESKGYDAQSFRSDSSKFQTLTHDELSELKTYLKNDTGVQYAIYNENYDTEYLSSEENDKLFNDAFLPNWEENAEKYYLSGVYGEIDALDNAKRSEEQ
jgi:hypothetical protein